LADEEFLSSTAENLEKMWKRCKKLTTIIVTMDRLSTLQQTQTRPSSNHLCNLQDIRAQKLISELISANPFENGDQVDLRIPKNGTNEFQGLSH